MWTEEKFERWKRPQLPPHYYSDISFGKNNNNNNNIATTHNIIFQHLDIDYYNGYPPERTAGGLRQKVPIIRMYGISKIGNTICCDVHGFFPYVYITCNSTEEEEEQILRNKLNVQFIKSFVDNELLLIREPILRIEKVFKKTIYEYQTHKRMFYKITLALPEIAIKFKRFLEKFYPEKEIFESNVDYVQRFMIDVDISGCCWIKLHPGTWKLLKPRSSSSGGVGESRCQIQIYVTDWKKLTRLKEIEEEDDHRAADDDDDEMASCVAPLRILSFDIECGGRRGIFPEPNVDPVIQIGNICTQYGSESSTALARVIFTLGECAPINDDDDDDNNNVTDIFQFNNEKEMLWAWSRFFHVIDPDIITGYNINRFDIPYLLDRANHLNLPNFTKLGRNKSTKSYVKRVIIEASQYENVKIMIKGRCVIDMYSVIRKEYKLRSYSLNSVSRHFLNEQKEDVHHSIITELQNGNALTRRRLAIYCMKDVELVIKLLDKLMTIINYIEMARVTGVSLDSVIYNGQQIKIFSQILRKAQKHGYIIPVFENTEFEEYEGATVIEPKRGFYNTPIVTLDFASLYPSIMIAHNLCYTTLVNLKTTTKNENDCVKTPSNYYFVKPEIHKGLIPEILESFLSARKRTKIALKSESDEWKKKILDGRQLAYKILANSVYGFTGAQFGKLPCLEISKSVTAFGRQMIELTRAKIEEQFTNATVIYGDTDSVMINFGVQHQDLPSAFSLGNQAAHFVSKFFEHPIKLEFEKVYFPYLLINKKRYAGLIYTRLDSYDKIDCKGMEVVRRDNCSLVATLINKCLEKILIDRDPEDAIRFAKLTISRLLQNKIDISQLIITKELRKREGDYKAKQAHIELVNKLKKRDPGSAPKLGDRVPYVIICGAKKEKIHERSEDPDYVVEKNLPIDFNYYLCHQLKKPLIRLFEPIMGRKTEISLFRGKHTQVRYNPISKISPLFKYVRIKTTEKRK